MPPVSPAYPFPPTKIMISDLTPQVVSIESKRWLFNGNPHHDEQFHRVAHALKAGRFAARCYPNAGPPQLRVCTSNVVMNLLYHPHTCHSSARHHRMTKNFHKRMIQTTSPGTCQHLETYIAIRRDVSMCKPCWALIEYANNLDMPDEVMDHPIIRNLGEVVIDLVPWSNTIIDSVGEMCRQSIDRLIEDRKRLPSWGSKTDKDVAVYVEGLANCNSANLHWPFDSELSIHIHCLRWANKYPTQLRRAELQFGTT
ncbi:hypothetical protein BDN67DRAFT_990582 [Paxillus ammoniavirescens]|nr:hypothetical protein BDN67DRAFT_990582 [Paxillus ammoniavirescens]